MRLTTADIERLLPQPGVSPGRPEDAGLDYKGGLPAPWTDKRNGWEARHECAKDVAALANHLGGYVIVGIDEDTTSVPGRSLPGAFTGIGGSDPEKQVKDWLNAALRPRELAHRVDVYKVTVRGNEVLVVQVPAWAEGAALVEWGTVNDRLGYFAAIRDADHTRYLDVRELERRMNAAGRRCFIRAHELLGQPNGQPKQLVIDVIPGLMVRHPGVRDFQLQVPLESGHAQAKAIDEGGITLGMATSQLAQQTVENHARNVGGVQIGQWLQEHTIHIPWSRIKDVWSQTVLGAPHVVLLLDEVRIHWQGGRYFLE